MVLFCGTCIKVVNQYQAVTIPRGWLLNGGFLLYMPGMGFNGPSFWPVSWIHAYACASRNLAPLTWFNFMLRNAV